MNLKSHKNASVNKVSKTLQKNIWQQLLPKLSRLLESLIVLHLVRGHRQQICKHNYDKHLKSQSKWLKMSMCPPQKSKPEAR